MAIDPSTLEWGYRTFAGGDASNQKANYSFNFNSGGQEYTFIPSSVINKGVSAGDTNYVLPWFLKEDNLKELGKNAQFVDLKGNSWYGDYLKDTVGASTEGFLVPAGSLKFDSVVKPTTAAVQGLGNTSEGLSYILDKQGSDGKYIASDGKITTITAGRSILGNVFGSVGDDLADSIMGGFEALNALPPVVIAAISAYNPALGAAITGAKIGGGVGSGQLSTEDAAKAVAAAYAGSQLGGEVGGATGSQVAGQVAGGTTSGLLQGQNLDTALTTGVVSAAGAQAGGALANAIHSPTTSSVNYGFSNGSSGVGLKANAGAYDSTDPYNLNATTSGGLGFNANLGAFDTANPYSFNTTTGDGLGINVPTQEGATLGSIGAQAPKTPAEKATQAALSSLFASTLLGSAGLTGTGNMATTDNSNLLGGLLGGVGSLLQGQTNVKAREEQASALRAAGQQAAQASQFRPVGTTTTFGTSNFQVDPTTGQLQSAGYSLSPQLQQYQNTLMAGGQQSLTDAANLQNLGRGYIAQSPEAAAQQYMASQQALLAPSRDMESARLANQLQQTGRTGVSVAQGGILGMANPEQQALANARMMQDLQLASQAQAQGRAQTQFGQGLLTSAYDPFNAGLTTAKGVEALGQQPFGMSADLAAQFQKAGAQGGALTLNAETAAANAMLPANQYNPYASLLSGAAGSSTGTTAAGGLLNNAAVGSALGSWLSGLGSSAANTWDSWRNPYTVDTTGLGMGSIGTVNTADYGGASGVSIR